jgi:hypothetical protein
VNLSVDCFCLCICLLCDLRFFWLPVPEELINLAGSVFCDGF